MMQVQKNEKQTIDPADVTYTNANALDIHNINAMHQLNYASKTMKLMILGTTFKQSHQRHVKYFQINQSYLNINNKLRVTEVISLILYNWGIPSS